MHRLHFNQSSVLRAGNGSGLFTLGSYSDYKTLCHSLKADDSLAIREAAALMASGLVLPQDSILIPMPSHLGYATNTLLLADAISELTGVPVMDALRGNCRCSVYDAKRHGHTVTAEELGFGLKMDVPAGLRPFILDNVVATGLTAGAAIGVLPEASVIALAVDMDKYVPR